MKGILDVRHYSITRKLTVSNMLVSGAALLLACLALGVYQSRAERESMVRALSIQAQIVSVNCASALLFSDAPAAEKTLQTLKPDPDILFAGIYTQQGAPLAVYWRGAPGRSPTLTELSAGETNGYSFRGEELVVTRAVVFQDKRLGTVVLRSDLAELVRAGRRFGFTVAAVLVMSLIAATLLSRLLQGAATQPILRLAETARIVSNDKNYSIRAPASRNHDEVSMLTEAFNEMLARIEARDVELRAAQERMNLALRSAGVGTWHWDMATRQLVWDSYVHPLFGLKPGEFEQRIEGLSKLVHPEDEERIMAEVWRSIETFIPLDTEYRVIWPGDGSVHILGARGKVFLDSNGAAERFLGVCWDITDRRTAEAEVRVLNEQLEARVAQRTAELEAANKELEAFTYSVAHDLRSPLRHIQGFSDALLEDHGPSLGPEATKDLRQIIASAQHMGCLINDLLALAHIGRQELRLHPTGLNSLLADVLSELKKETQGRQIEWRIGDLPFVDCDAGLIKLVLSNLLSNAVKYTRPRTAAVIEVGVREIDCEAAIYVRDNGVGFNMKYADKLFGVFQRLHRREDFEGTGVGLATVQRIVHKHGGRIWVEAELNRGATFYFTLYPRVDSPQPPATK